MVGFELEKKQLEIIEKYKDFTSRWIIPQRKKWDELAEFPWEIVKAAYDENIINGTLPVEYGGNGFSIFESALTSEEFGYGCTGIGISIDASTLALTPTFLAATDEQKKRIYGEMIEKKAVAAYGLTEPDAGSDALSMRTRAKQCDGGYIINGTKLFISNGPIADAVIVFASEGELDSVPLTFGTAASDIAFMN